MKVSGRTQLGLSLRSGLQSVHGVIARHHPGRLLKMPLPICGPQWEPKAHTWGMFRHPPAPMGAAAPQEAPSHRGFPSALPGPSPGAVLKDPCSGSGCGVHKCSVAAGGPLGSLDLQRTHTLALAGSAQGCSTVFHPEMKKSPSSPPLLLAKDLCSYSHNFGRGWKCLEHQHHNDGPPLCVALP